MQNFSKFLLKRSLLLLMACFAFALANAQTGLSSQMREFMDMRFGMFIHWGPVSLRGTEIGWSRTRQVPASDYDNLYKEFNPVLFSADDWVKTAKDAGMKYLVITARHHDGFCLWPTKYTTYNISNTPFKKDVVGALQKACKKYGIKFGIYYSDLDWWHKDYPMHSPDSKIPDPKSNMNTYINYVKNQLKELIELYDPYLFWFDGQWEKPWTDSIGREVYNYVKALNPNLIVNNRLGKEMAGDINKKIDPAKMIGDYDTPEQVVGRMNMTTPWESCFTICNQWAWKPNDKMKPLSECLRILSQTAGGNGNLLLNVGPMPDGRIEARQSARLKEVGDWLKTNGSAVYKTMGGPYPPNKSFSTTRKGNKIFVHIINTDTAAISLKNIPGVKIVKAYTMDGTPVKINTSSTGFELQLPPALKDGIEYIIVLETNQNTEQLALIN
ncbi:MAG: alpha-L-fucosidase [Bacteroidetes bacterium]|nr:alpha-L-fucosidase [Bacteroidota bacterium]MBS1610467.1 alpha-L-fucosidase [Bacteroidota bacterium]